MSPRSSWKPFTSFLILCAFLVSFVSGLVLYVAPPGRRKTVARVCSELGIDVAEGLARLERAGLRASAGDTMREVANAHGRTPHDVLPVSRQ